MDKLRLDDDIEFESEKGIRIGKYIKVEKGAVYNDQGYVTVNNYPDDLASSSCAPVGALRLSSGTTQAQSGTQSADASGTPANNETKNLEIQEASALEIKEAVNETTTKNVIDRIHDGVCAVYDAGIVQNDYEWAAVYKAIEEIKAFDRFSYTEFVELLKDSGRFAEGELPSASSISKITIKGEYPNWKVYDKGYKVNRQILDVGKCFFEGFNKG